MGKYRIRISQWNESKERFDRSYSEDSYDLTDKAEALSCLKEAWAALCSGAEVRLVQARLNSIDVVDTDELFDSPKPANRRSSKKSAK